MRAIHCVVYGEPKQLVLVDVPEPVPRPEEVLVAVEAAGLGYADALRARGAYQVKAPLPYVPGGEMAGRVVGLGPGVAAEWQGRAVLGIAPRGALAERTAVPVAALVQRPERLGAEAAAGMIVNYGTAVHGLEERGCLRAGEIVLILGASGGVGLAAIDLAKALGATVIAAASSAAKLAACSARGADHTVDYSQPEWRKALEAVLAGRPLTLVYDPVGGAYSETAFRCLAPGGRLLVVGFAAGEIPRIPLNLPLLKRASIVGVDWGGHQRANPGAAQAELRRLIELVEAGTIHPAATTVYPLENTGEVLQSIVERRNLGKAVIRVASGP
jgi:NADPH2:quinone reductase